MWESSVTEKSPSPCPPPPSSSSSSSWSMMKIMGHHHHHDHDHEYETAHDHHVKQGSMAPPCSVSRSLPLIPHLSNYKLIKALGNGNMGTVFLGLFLPHNQAPQTSPESPESPSDFRKDEETNSDESLHVMMKPHVSSHDPGLVALKVMSKEEMWKKGMAKRASMEREVLMACSHGTCPFLPSLNAHFESDTHQVLVMDYCCGGDLNHLRSCNAINEGGSGTNKFSEEDARFYGAEIILALEKLHALGFVYRDLKPENVMVRGNGHIMLADFDLCLKLPSQPAQSSRAFSGKIRSLGKLKRWAGARMASSLASCVNASESARVSGSGSSSGTTRVTPVLQAAANSGSRTGRSLSFVGTEEYVAPEILWGTGHDLAVDWWTLGILLFDLVSGSTPFRSLTRKETFFNILCKEPKLDTCLPTASPQFLDLVSRLLCKQPSDRLGSSGGAHEIKSHPFFHGVNWDSHHEIPNPPYTPSPHMLVLDSLQDNDTLLESQLTIAEHRRRMAHASANNLVHTHHHDFRVF